MTKGRERENVTLFMQSDKYELNQYKIVYYDKNNLIELDLNIG